MPARLECDEALEESRLADPVLAQNDGPRGRPPVRIGQAERLFRRPETPNIADSQLRDIGRGSGFSRLSVDRVALRQWILHRGASTTATKYSPTSMCPPPEARPGGGCGAEGFPRCSSRGS